MKLVCTFCRCKTRRIYFRWMSLINPDDYYGRVVYKLMGVCYDCSGFGYSVERISRQLASTHDLAS